MEFCDPSLGEIGNQQTLGVAAGKGAGVRNNAVVVAVVYIELKVNQTDKSSTQENIDTLAVLAVLEGQPHSCNDHGLMNGSAEVRWTKKVN